MTAASTKRARPASSIEHPYTLSNDSLNFGNVATDSVAWDTLTIEFPHSVLFTGAYATYPFQPAAPPPGMGARFVLPVRFAPPHTGPFAGTLSFTAGSYFFQIPLRGRGTASGPMLSLSASPNPCNLSTRLRYTLPAASVVKLTLYDVLGRVAKQVDVEMQLAGEHNLHLDLTGLASGVYFTHLEAAGQRTTQKLLLLK